MSGMLGLISSGPTSDPEAQARRAELIPGTAGDVLGAAVSEGFSDSPGPRMARVARRGYIDTGGGNYAPLNAEDDLGLPTGLLPPSPMVPLDVLKRDYEIPGMLSFDKDTPQSVAQSLYEHKRDQLYRSTVLARADNMLTQGAAARFVASMIGSIADPVNLAAMFVPGVNEATAARMLAVGAGAGAGARAGVRALSGATAGAAGMLALEPLNYALMQQERDDWTMGGALLNVLIGTVAGAGLHSGLGALTERARGLPEWAPARAVSERLQAAKPEVQDALARGAVAAQAEGRPFDASAILDLAENPATGGVPATAVAERAARAAPEADSPAPRRAPETANEALVDYYRAVQTADAHAPITVEVDGRPVSFPDRAHADLFDVGERLLRGEDVPAEDVARLWQHFRGMVEDDPALGRPFSAPEHVADLAREYAGPEMDMRGPMARTPDGETFEAGSVVATDARAPYAERAAGVARAATTAAEGLRVARAKAAQDAMRDLTTPRADPAAAQPPPPASRTGAAPAEPHSAAEPGAAAKDLSSVEKEIADLDEIVRLSKNEALTERLKVYDAADDIAAKEDRAVFEAAANCLVRRI